MSEKLWSWRYSLLDLYHAKIFLYIRNHHKHNIFIKHGILKPSQLLIMTAKFRNYLSFRIPVLSLWYDCKQDCLFMALCFGNWLCNHVLSSLSGRYLGHVLNEFCWRKLWKPVICVGVYPLPHLTTGIGLTYFPVTSGTPARL